jgi:hypothetical protein
LEAGGDESKDRVVHRSDDPTVLFEAWTSFISNDEYHGRKLSWAHLTPVVKIVCDCFNSWVSDNISRRLFAETIKKLMHPDTIYHRMIIDRFLAFVGQRLGRKLSAAEQEEWNNYIINALKQPNVVAALHNFETGQDGGPVTSWLHTTVLPQLLGVAPLLHGASWSFFHSFLHNITINSVLHSAAQAPLSFIHPIPAQQAVRSAPDTLKKFTALISGFNKRAAGAFGKGITDRIRDVLEGKFDNLVLGFMWTVVDTSTSSEAFTGFANAQNTPEVLRILDRDLSTLRLKYLLKFLSWLKCIFTE